MLRRKFGEIQKDITKGRKRPYKDVTDGDKPRSSINDNLEEKDGLQTKLKENVIQRLGKDVTNKKIPRSSVSFSLEEKDGLDTLNNIITATKNPSTVFKPPFGTNVEEHRLRLGEHAQRLWRFSKITDLVVKLEGKEYPCHKTVLSCYSKYFKELLLEEKKVVNVINLRIPAVTNRAFEALLTYMYTSNLNLTCQNIGEVYTAARKLGVDGALILCSRILSGQSKHDVYSVYVYATAKKLGLRECAVKALKIMTRKFEYIVGTPEFLDLNASQVREYLSQDALATRSEVIVFLAALKWLSVKYLEREEHVVDVIKCVRFQMMTLNEILACFSPPLLPGILELKEIKDAMLKATCYVAAATIDEEKRFERFSCKPRRYLLERETFILWDPSIFDPKRHEMYLEEISATKIQAAFRGYKARKSIEADKSAGILKPPEVGFSLKRNLADLNEFKLPVDGDDDTIIGSVSDTEDLFLTRIRKSILGFMGVGEVDETSEDREKKDENKVEEYVPEKLNAKENNQTYEDEDEYSLFSRRTSDLSRSSSVDTLVGHLNDLAETTEIKKYASNTDVSSEIFQTAHQKLETIHKVYMQSTTENYHNNLDSSSTSGETANGRQKMKGFILTTGGFRSDKTNDFDGQTMFRYNVAKNKWRRFGRMDRARHHHCSVFLHDEVYFIGGCNPERTKSGKMVPEEKCYKFNLKSKKWSKISKMKYSRMYHGVAEVNEKIYVVGGRDAEDRLLNSIEVYDPYSNKWEELDARLEAPTMGSGVCAHQEKIWVIGGIVQDKNGTSQFLSAVKCYDPIKNKWNYNIKKLPSPRGFSTVVSLENEIYVIGGLSQDAKVQDQQFSSISDILHYDMKENRWILAATLPFSRHFVNANVVGSNLYILGGLNASEEDDVDKVIMYDKETGTWYSCASLPDSLCGFTTVFVPEANLSR